jgi:hypothetical protein
LRIGKFRIGKAALHRFRVAASSGCIVRVCVLHHPFCGKDFEMRRIGRMMWRRTDRKARMGFCGLSGNPLQYLFED